MARRKQTKPHRTATEGAVPVPEVQVSTPDIKEKKSPCRKSDSVGPSAQEVPISEWVEVIPKQIVDGSIPVAELTLQRRELAEQEVDQDVQARFLKGPLKIKLRVPVLRLTARQLYSPQEVVCQVYQPESVAAQSTGRHFADSTEQSGEDLTSGAEGRKLFEVEADASEVFGHFDGPPSGVSALVALVRAGLVTLQGIPRNLRSEPDFPPEQAGEVCIQSSESLSFAQDQHQEPKWASTSPPFEEAQTHNTPPQSPQNDGRPGSLSSQDSSLPTARVLLTPAAFSDAPKDPTDEQRKLTFTWVQSLMQWLRPELGQLVEFGPGHESRLREKTVIRSPDAQNEEALVAGEDRKGKQKLLAEESQDVALAPCESQEEAETGHEHGGFDPKELYAAVRPSRHAPMLAGHFPALLPTLRPYQRRAAAWMVARERGAGSTSFQGASTSELGPRKHPLWLRVGSLDGGEAFWYNPFVGRLSREGFSSPEYVRGGILADEMGLGKTVELLTCILANPMSDTHSAADRASLDAANKISQRRKERIDCPCGGTWDKSEIDAQFWVQCHKCLAWQHTWCVGYVPRKRHKKVVKEGLSSEGQTRVDKTADGEEAGPSIAFEPTGETTQQRKNDRSEYEKDNTSAVLEKAQQAEPKSDDRSKRKRDSDALGADSDAPNDGHVPFTCGECSALLGGMRVEGAVGATLIVCPTSILQQWREEIAKHTRPGSVKVVVYEGVQRSANPSYPDDDVSTTSGAPLAPSVVGAHDLAKADIVLTTYDALRADLAHEPLDTEGPRLRSKKRYVVVPTPLTKLRWWRVCLDEAQMVESSTAKATEMALKLKAVNRWCVSGTPIQRGLEDLYGLLKFLQAEPFDSRFWWNRAFQGPYEAGHVGAKQRAHAFLRELMWRNSKTDVQDEIGLPPQTERIERLRFSAVEAHFYRRQHDDVASKARDVIRKHRKAAQSNCERTASEAGPSTAVVGEAPLGTSAEPGKAPVDDLSDRLLTHGETAKLMVPLLRLRQACCHPQVGSSGIRSLTQQRSPMTMEEILGVLVEKARVEAEEAQRLMVSSLNGLGGLALIEGDRTMAIKAYREALQVVEENEVKDGVRADPLQKLHTLHNLAQALGYQPNPYSGTALLTGERKSAELSQAESGSKEGVTEETKNAAKEDQKGKRKLKQGTVLGSKRQRKDANGEIKLETGGSLQGQDLPPEVPRTLRDDKLLGEAEEIRARYVAAFQAKLAVAEKEYRKVHDEVVESIEACQNEPGGVHWWLSYIRNLNPQSEEALVQHVKDKLLENDRGMLDVRQKNASNLALRFKDVRGLTYVLQKELDAINASRESLLDSLEALNGPPTEELVERAGDCATCHTDMHGEICAHCQMDELFQNYEPRLFKSKTTAMGLGSVVTADDAIAAQSMKFKRDRAQFLDRMKGGKQSEKGPQLWEEASTRFRQGGAGATADVQTTTAPSDAERTLRFILDFMRRNGAGQDGEGAMRAARRHLEAMEGMRKEFIKARTLSGAQREVIYALDELGMAVTRVRLRLPGETFESEVEKNTTIPEYEIPSANHRFTTEKYAAESDLKKCTGTLRYLKGLKSSRDKATPSHTVSQKRSLKVDCSGKDGSLQLDVNRAESEAIAGPSKVPGSSQPATSGQRSEPAADSSEEVRAVGNSEPGTSGRQTEPAADSSGELQAVGTCEPGTSGQRSEPAADSLGELRAAGNDQPGSSAGAAGSLGDSQPSSDDICPVCQDRLGIELVILPCGHMLCCRCAMRMIDHLEPPSLGSSPKKQDKKLKCPTCRQSAFVGDLAYVNGVVGTNQPGTRTKQQATGGEDRVEVKGSLSTKMDAVVRRVLWVTQTDPDAKFLIFSTWHEVLDLVAHALQENGVLFERAKGRNALNPAIRKFRKTGARAPRALLLPFSQGANGLNLVEGQHVVLIEPLLNPGVEAQAVGRVHRIGQTKPTFVHRFIIEDSVEEGILALSRKKAETEGGELRKTRKEDALTLRDLGSLFGGEKVEVHEDEGLLLQSASEESSPEGHVPLEVTPREAAAIAAEGRRQAALHSLEE